MKKYFGFKWLAIFMCVLPVLNASYYISTIAGTGNAGFSGDNGLATLAKLNSSNGVCVTADAIFIADTSNNRIRKISGNSGYNIISTIAGTGATGYSGDGAAAKASTLHNPFGIFVHSSGSIYIADTYNHCIRKIEGNIIKTIAGTGAAGYSGDGGAATAATFCLPHSVFVDSTNNVYVADTFNNCIRRFTEDGTIATIAGTRTQGYSGDGGSATAAKLNTPYGICVDSLGNIYIADTRNNVIRKFIAGGNISTFAGGGTGYFTDTDRATEVVLAGPMGVCVDISRNVYIADTYQNAIRVVNTGGAISTIAGTGSSGYDGDGGRAINATLSRPTGIWVDKFTGNVSIADKGNNCIRYLTMIHGLRGGLRRVPTFMTIELDGDSATVSANLNASAINKTGAGTAVFSGDNSELGTLQIEEGLVQVNDTSNIGGSVVCAGGDLQVTGGSLAVPSITVGVDATLTVDSAADVSLAMPLGDALLTIAGEGVVTPNFMGSSTTPILISGIVHVGASSDSTMTKGATTVASGGLLEIMGATAMSVPGITEIQPGGKLQVLAGVAVPANGASNGDIFNDGSTGGSLQLDADSTLKLGDGSSWARDIMVGTAL
ncbi:MAG: hypothetical protein WCJ92_04230 [Alphaproteobacteria bacterium]